MTFLGGGLIYRIIENISAGGIVMIPLIIVSIVMWGMIIDRAFFFSKLSKKNISRNKAMEFVTSNEFPDMRIYKGITALFVREFLHRRSGDSTTNKFILDETVLALVLRMDKYLATIGALARIAPLLGLLGTVMGMMATFDIISVFGTGNARAMASGISEALITTQTGLLIAIPGLYMRNYLNRRSENLKHRISTVGIYLKRYV